MTALAALVLPPGLAQLRLLSATEEIASSLRHRSLGELSAIGALLMLLGRRITRHPTALADADIRGLLDDLDRRVLQAAEGVPSRTLPAPDRDRSPVVALDAAVEALLGGLTGAAALPLTVTPGGHRVAMDRDELQVALSCLLENALDAVARGGAVSLSSRPDPSVNEVIVEIVDEGEGLPPEAGDRLFEPFFSTRPGRLGLGLKIARRLARRWAGDVAIAPAPGRQGTRAQLLLPRA